MKYPVIILVLLICNLSVSAQIEREPVGDKTDTMKLTTLKGRTVKLGQKERLEELDLSREQKGKIREIRQAGKAAKEAIENNTQLSDQDKKKQVRELQKEQMQKIHAILTPEQREKFKASKPNDP